MKNKHIRALTYGAVCVGLSFALSWVVFFRMPQGGSITLASLVPIVLYIYLFGIKYGLLATIAFTLLQLFNPYYVNPMQIVLDYLIPYMALVLVGVVPIVTDRVGKRNRIGEVGLGEEQSRPIGRVTEWGIYVGMGIFTLIRFASQTLSGVLFFEAPLWFSMLYNSFGIIDSAIATIALVALFRSKTFKRELDRIRAFNKTRRPQPVAGIANQPIQQKEAADNE